MPQEPSAQRLIAAACKRAGIAATNRKDAKLLGVELGLLHPRVLSHDRRTTDENGARRIHLWLTGETNPNFEGTVALLTYLGLLTAAGKRLTADIGRAQQLGEQAEGHVAALRPQALPDALPQPRRTRAVP